MDKNNNFIGDISFINEEEEVVLLKWLLEYRNNIMNDIDIYTKKVNSLTDDLKNVSRAICDISCHQFGTWKKYEDIYVRRCSMCGMIEKSISSPTEDFVNDNRIVKKRVR